MDFDGTVTEKGNKYPSKKMVEVLFRTAKKVPIAFCTGRELGGFVEHGLKTILKEIKKEVEAQKFLRNFCVLAENGSIGYFFDEKTNRFKEIYHVKWPKKFFSRKKLLGKLQKVIGKNGKVMNVHQISVVMRSHLSSDDKIKKVYERSEKNYKAVTKFLSKIDPDYEKFLHVGNSGIGIIVLPANGDKDNGIKRFAEYLFKNKKIKFSENFKEIMCIGDQPKYSGNDHYLLKGKYGTPFTVGDYEKNKILPFPVLNKQGKRLLHAKGTAYLLQKTFI